MPEEINIVFNSETNEKIMVPSSHTCSCTINLSTIFLTVNNIMTELLAKEFMWRRFDLI